MNRIIEKELAGYRNYLLLRVGLSSRTVESYAYDLKGFLEKGVGNDGQGALRFLNGLRENGYKPSSIARKSAALRKYLKQKGFPLKDFGVKGQRRTGELPKFLTLARIEKLLAAAGTAKSKKKALRERVLVELLYTSGIRISEACGVKWNDILLEKGMIKVQGKGGKERWVPFGKRLYDLLLIYRTAEPSKFLLPGRGGNKPISRVAAWKIFRGLCQRAGLHASPHWLRHSFAAHCEIEVTALFFS